MRRFVTRAIMLVSLFLAAGNPALGIDSTVPGVVETETTFHCTGVKWWIEGDDDLDCAVDVSYREVGAGVWSSAQPLLRVEPGSFNDFDIDPGNLLAGSVFGLTPDHSYELRLSLVDPDGGSAEEIREIRTRTTPVASPDARIRYVVPGAGGGSGTEGDPFRGLASADAAAAPGDLFLLQSGVYADSIVFTMSGTEADPIVYRGVGSDSVFLDGESFAANVVWLPAIRYLHLENLTIRRPRERCIIGYATEGIVIRGCHLDVSVRSGWEQFGIDLRGPGHRDALIAGNRIQGYLEWEDGRTEDAYALIVSGPGHVIRANEINGWFDGIQVGGDEATIETSGCDVYGNEIYDCIDDGIETDAARHNIRVFGNRLTNCFVGLSAQPVFGGPVYFIRNVVYNWQLKPLKFHLWPTGLIVFHNTLVGADSRGWGGGQWRHTILRNNLILGGSQPGHEGDPICMDTIGDRADLDFGGWYQAYPDRFADFNGDFYATLGEFRAATGMEINGRLVTIDDFLDAEEPPPGSWLGQDGFPPPYTPGAEDLRLAPGSQAVDVGASLANINDLALGDGPDLGAYEQGSEIPIYGPAAESPTEAGEESGELPAHSRPRIAPNPFHRETVIRWRQPQAGVVTVRVFDPAGRLVRSLEDGSGKAGSVRSLAWDGRDGQGRRVCTGPYFVRIAGEAFGWVGTVLLLR